MSAPPGPPAAPLHAAPPAPFAALCGALLSQGAEACVYACTYLGQACVLKHRLPKAYRHAALDERLCRERLAGESRATARARRLGIPVPLLLLTDAPSGCLVLERIPGPTVKAWLQAGGAGGAHAEAVAAHVGATIARLHAAGLAHGDLTTSNLMLRGRAGAPWEEAAAAAGGGGGGSREAWGLPRAHHGAAVPAGVLDPADEADEEGSGGGGGGGADEELMLELSGLGAGAGAGGGAAGLLEPTRADAAPPLAPAAAAGAPLPPPLPPLPPAAHECVLIDFGLACQNASLEDMGVDLYVLERALASAHARDATRLFAAILAAYTAHLTAIAPRGHHGAAAVAGKFAAVRQRGRKRVAFG